MTNRNVKTFNGGIIINACCDAGRDLVGGSNTVETAISAVAEQAVIVGLQQRRIVVIDAALVAVRHIQVLHAWFQRLGIPRRQHRHIAFEDELTVDFKLRHDAVNRIFQFFAVIGVVPVQIRLLIVRRHQLRFGVQTAPAVGERQTNGRLQVDAGRFRHIVFGVDKVHRLTVNPGIKRAEIVMVVVNV
ncbi:Uncharacterised protein [Salmonella enterica subsp. enterica serovar Typhi]|nr:Uncharacterised protein [Salmonella enterica subsp. enterica serovar Typhi]